MIAKHIFISAQFPGPEIYISGWVMVAPYILSDTEDGNLIQGFEETAYIHVFQLFETSEDYRSDYSKCFGL